MPEVVDWLKALGMSEYAERFSRTSPWASRAACRSLKRR